MNIKGIKIEGGVPWRLSEGQLVQHLNDLPVHIYGTRDLRLHAYVGGGGIVRIIPQSGKITEYSIHNIRNPRIYPENGATYVLFKYHGVSYELGTASPFSYSKDKKRKTK